jgi:membrane-associated phospholipid phosphatase
MNWSFFSFRQYTAADCATQGYIAFIGILVLLLHGDSVPDWPVRVGAHVVGVLALHWLIWASPRGFLGFLRDFYPILLIAVLWREIGSINQMFVASYQDAFFVQADQVLFGVQPSVWLMDRFPHRWTSELFYGAYFSYYVMILGIGIALHHQNRDQFRHYLSVLFLVFFSCFMIYVFLPVIGARIFSHEFAGFHLPDGICDVTWPHPYPASVTDGFMYKVMAVLYQHFEVDGAAFPSSHVAVSLCTLTFSWRFLKPIRWVHLVVFVLLCISTVYCRYHYAIDVLGGLVYGGAWCWIGNRLYARLDRDARQGRDPDALREREPG